MNDQAGHPAGEQQIDTRRLPHDPAGVLPGSPCSDDMVACQCRLIKADRMVLSVVFDLSADA